MKSLKGHSLYLSSIDTKRPKVALRQRDWKDQNNQYNNIFYTCEIGYMRIKKDTVYLFSMTNSKAKIVPK